MSKSNEDTNTVQEPIFDPFPKPVTMPSGWDLSELTSASEPAPAAPADNTPDTSTP